MSKVDELAGLQRANGRPDPITAAERLTEILGLAESNIGVRGAHVFGLGRTASVEVVLSNGKTMHFEQGKLMTRPAELAAEVVSCGGKYPKLNGRMAGEAYSLVYALGEHHDTETAISIAVDWGTSYLQAAPVLDIDLDDQAERWAAFSKLHDTIPSGGDRDHPSNYAARTLVLRHRNQDRFVRIGWFYDYVQKSEGGGIARRELSQRMRQIGWLLNGKTGRIKATCPSRPETLGWNFYKVPQGWEVTE